MNAPAPRPDKRIELDSVRAQLAFLKDLAQRNASWMAIAYNPADARAAIGQNKLALVLSVEMDSLDVNDILDLVQNHGVRQVVPIHLANNSFGGVALYSDVFNSANQYLNGAFYEAQRDPSIEFRLQWPQKLVSHPLGVVEVKAVTEPEYKQTGYQPTGAEPEPGHRNPRGLANAGDDLVTLMRKGLLLDLAHMSQASQEAALALATSAGFPLMNSHTGLRGAQGDSERSMRNAEAQQMGQQGGVLGLGTDPGEYGKLLVSADGEPLARLTTARSSYSLSLERRPALTSDLLATNLVIVVETGDQDLHGGANGAWGEAPAAQWQPLPD
ncbi:MAG: membrane dipeptidase [Myxococcales bacterium]